MGWQGRRETGRLWKPRLAARCPPWVWRKQQLRWVWQPIDFFGRFFFFWFSIPILFFWVGGFATLDFLKCEKLNKSYWKRIWLFLERLLWRFQVKFRLCATCWGCQKRIRPQYVMTWWSPEVKTIPKIFETWSYTGWWQLKYFLFSPRKLGKISILTNIFQMGWSHQLVHLW